MAPKRRLSFWEIWNMSIGFLGIQFGFALQNANTSRIFETLGADTKNLAIYWLAAPVTGLIIQPIIGYYSDRTWHPKWGRRRPYFAIGAIFATIALCLMPNSSALWMAVGVLWIMDASINISMEPFRAFVGDMLPAEQRTRGFAMQSFFIGIGAIVASFMPWIFANWLNIPNTAPEGEIPPSVKYSFYLGALMFLVTVMWTVLKTKEYPPEELVEDGSEEGHAEITDMEKARFMPKFTKVGSILLVIGAAFSTYVYFSGIDPQLYVMGGGLAFFGIMHLIAYGLLSKDKKGNALVHIVKDFNDMPKTMVQLAIVQFFSWFALFSMWIYTTPAVTSHIYNTTDTTSADYNQGADLVGNLFGIYNGIAALAALALPWLARKTNRRITHLIALCLGGIGLISVYFMSSPDTLWISMIGIGIAWASILSIPYAMLSGSLPAEKMGYYMGVFNFFIVIPQIIAAALLGFILTTFFNGEPIYILVTGGISMILAGFLSLMVNDQDEAITT